MQSDKLIFGKDETQRIVNISLKGDQAYIYTQDGNGEINLEQFAYTPWVLSHKPVKRTSERLKGEQFWKYITSTSCIKFNDLQKKYQRDLWLPRNIEECITLAEGLTYYKGLKVQDVSILSFDIETSGLVMDGTSKVFLISNTFRKGNEVIRKLFSIEDYIDEEELIYSWTVWVREVNPSILCGHNILSYDLPYLRHCFGHDLNLGRDNSLTHFSEKTSKFRKDGSQQYDYHNVRITGREIIDTFFLSMKYDIARELPSYGLKPIIKHLGLEKSDRSFVDASKIREYYAKRHEDPEMWEKVKRYAVEDSDDSLKLFDIMIPSYFYLAQSVPKTMQQMINEATGSQLDSLMVRAYLQDGYSQPQTSGKVAFEGAISMGRPGVYEHVCKADVASLYPSIMLEYNIHDPKKDPNNYMIQMLTYFRDERLKNKKLAKETGEKYYSDMEQSQKICINSLYGFLGAGFLLYNYPKGAAEVTRRGREILLTAVEWATGHTLNRVVKNIVNDGKEDEYEEYEWTLGASVGPGMGQELVNVDTDSFSITKGTKTTSAEFAIFLDSLNSLYSPLIKWENDGIYEKVLVIRAKNYVLVKDSKVKFKGSGLTDQKKEPALLEMLEDMIDTLLFGDPETLPYIYQSYVREALDIKYITRWSTKKTITKSVLKPERLTEQKILNAIQETIDEGVVESVQAGDKVWVFNAVNGEIQKTEKGYQVFYKDGRPKMIPNCVLRDSRLFNGEYNKMHYVSRVYSTVEILSNVLDMSKFIDYSKKSNQELLKGLTKNEKCGTVKEESRGLSARSN